MTVCSKSSDVNFLTVTSQKPGGVSYNEWEHNTLHLEETGKTSDLPYVTDQRSKTHRKKDVAYTDLTTHVCHIKKYDYLHKSYKISMSIK